MNSQLNRPKAELDGYYEDRERMRWLGHYLLLRAACEDDEVTPRAGTSRRSRPPVSLRARRARHSRRLVSRSALHT